VSCCASGIGQHSTNDCAFTCRGCREACGATTARQMQRQPAASALEAAVTPASMTSGQAAASGAASVLRQVLLRSIRCGAMAGPRSCRHAHHLAALLPQAGPYPFRVLSWR